MLRVQLEQWQCAHILRGCYALRCCWWRGNHFNLNTCMREEGLMKREEFSL